MESILEFINEICFDQNFSTEQAVLHHLQSIQMQSPLLPIVCLHGYTFCDGCVLFTKISSSIINQLIVFMCTLFPNMVFSVGCYSFDPSLYHVSGFRVHFKTDDNVLPYSVLLSNRKTCPFHDCSMYSFTWQIYMAEQTFGRLDLQWVVLGKKYNRRTWRNHRHMHIEQILLRSEYVTMPRIELLPVDKRLLNDLRWKLHLHWLFTWIYKNSDQTLNTVDFRRLLASFL